MNHLDEKTMALFVLGGKEVENQRVDIEAHLSNCEGCAALYNEMKEQFTEVSDLARTHRQAITVANRVALEKKEKQGDVVITLHNTPLARLLKFTTEHPAAIGLSLGAFVIGVLALLVGPVLARDTNPSFARAKSEFLVIYNHRGDELWRKHVGPGFDASPPALARATESNQLFSVIDVDRDGTNEVVAVFGWAISDSLARGIYCYDRVGVLKWKYNLHRSLPFGTLNATDDYRFNRMMVGDFEGKGKVEIFGIAAHIPYFPSIVVKIEASNGRFLGEYLHSGRLEAATHLDLDADGVEELLIGGTNNGYNRAALVVLDPRLIDGASPAPPTHSAGSALGTNEKAYVLFPRLDLADVYSGLRGLTTEISQRSNSLLQIGVTFGYDKEGRPIGVSYYFARDLRCVRASGADGLEFLMRNLHRGGKIESLPDTTFYANLCAEIEYWNGKEFVKQDSERKGSKTMITAK